MEENQAVRKNRLAELIRDSRFLFILLAIIVGLALIDSLILNTIIFSHSVDHEFMLDIFISISLIFVIAQSFILLSIHFKIKENIRKAQGRKGPPMLLVRITSMIIQCILVAILLSIILQLVFQRSYSNDLVIIATILSYSLVVSLMALLSYRFLSWFKSKKNSAVLLYALSSVVIGINAASTLVLIGSLLNDIPETVRPHIGVSWPNLAPGSTAYTLNNVVLTTSIISFMITWAATVMLLHHYSKRIGKALYWTIVVIPLVYFLSQFITISQELTALLTQIMNPVSYSVISILLFSMSRFIGGSLFGIVFWDTARSIHQGTIKDFMIIAGFSFVLLFISNQAFFALAVSWWPPFGLINILFFGLSSYLVLVSIYYSADSVARDSELRQTIRKKAAPLIESIGTAQAVEEIRIKALDVIKENQDAIEIESWGSIPFSEDDARQYVDSVIKELKEKKEDKDNKDSSSSQSSWQS